MPAVPIDGPVGRGQVSLDRRHKRIEAVIENRTMVEVHDLMAVAAVITAAHSAEWVPLQGNDRPIAIPEAVRCPNHRLHSRADSGQTLQGINHGAAFPVLLCFLLKVLEGTSTAAAGQDAGLPLAIRAGLIDPVQTG
jgi:hypothetical protein